MSIGGSGVSSGITYGYVTDRHQIRAGHTYLKAAPPASRSSIPPPPPKVEQQCRQPAAPQTDPFAQTLGLLALLNGLAPMLQSQPPAPPPPIVVEEEPKPPEREPALNTITPIEVKLEVPKPSLPKPPLVKIPSAMIVDEITDGSSPADTTITFDWEKSVPIPPPAGETGNWYRGVLHNDLLKAYGPNLTSSEKANVYDELSKANAYKEGNTTVIPNYAKGETSQQHTIKLPVIEGLPTPDPKLITPQDYKTETGKGGGNKNAEYERDITNTPIKTTKFIATYTDINGRVFTNSFDNEIDAEKYIQQLDDKVYIKKRIKEE